MPKSFLGRGAGLAAVTAALSLGATGVADAALVKAYDFHNGSPQASFDGAEMSGELLEGFGTTTARFDAGDGYVLPASVLPANSFTIDMTIELGAVDTGTTSDASVLRLLTTGSGSDQSGLGVVDGVLAFLDNTGAPTGTPDDTMLSTGNEQLTIVRDAGGWRVYRNNASTPDLQLNATPAANPFEFTLFTDPESAEEPAGDMRRLRLFSHALTGGEVDALDAFDTQTPTGELPAGTAASKLIAAGKRTFVAPGSGKLTVKLTKRGRSLLRKKKSRRISVRTIIVPRGGAPIADTQKLTIKR